MIDERTIMLFGNDRSIPTVRAEVNRVLDVFEAEGMTIDAFAVELVKLGTALAIPSRGPAETIEGLFLLSYQLINTFPDAWSIVQARMKCKGSA